MITPTPPPCIVKKEPLRVRVLRESYNKANATFLGWAICCAGFFTLSLLSIILFPPFVFVCSLILTYGCYTAASHWGERREALRRQLEEAKTYIRLPYSA